MRLHKYMALCGVASRRKSEVIISEGRVELNGILVTSPGMQVDENIDNVKVDNILISLDTNKVYIMFNKPLECVTTSSDQFNRTTVMDYITGISERIYPIGRLDYNTTGLLLLTNDGDIANKIMHPSSHLSKVYIAKVNGKASKNDLEKFRNGIYIDGKMTSKAKIEVIRENDLNSILKMEIYEGRNRQIRKMLDEITLPVVTLKRIEIGKIGIGNLPIGEFRFLTDKEINYLKGY